MIVKEPEYIEKEDWCMSYFYDAKILSPQILVDGAGLRIAINTPFVSNALFQHYSEYLALEFKYFSVAQSRCVSLGLELSSENIIDCLTQLIEEGELPHKDMFFNCLIVDNGKYLIRAYFSWSRDDIYGLDKVEVLKGGTEQFIYPKGIYLSAKHTLVSKPWVKKLDKIKTVNNGDICYVEDCV